MFAIVYEPFSHQGPKVLLKRFDFDREQLRSFPHRRIEFECQVMAVGNSWQGWQGPTEPFFTFNEKTIGIFLCEIKSGKTYWIAGLEPDKVFNAISVPQGKNAGLKLALSAMKLFTGFFFESFFLFFQSGFLIFRQQNCVRNIPKSNQTVHIGNSELIRRSRDHVKTGNRSMNCLTA